MNFWPDAGDWRWRLWGNGELRPFGASWRIAGRGAWQDHILCLSAAQGEMDRFRYGLIDAHAPRRRRAGAGGRAGARAIEWKLERGAAARSGLVAETGRYGCSRRCCNRHWASGCSNGEFYAQSAFSTAANQGFIAWRKAAGVRIRQSAALHIDEIISPIALRERDTGLKGFYPFDDDHPFTLIHMTLKTLGGQVSLTPLRLPQHAPAVLKVQGVEIGALITALKPKQFAMSGRVSGAS